MQTAKKLLFTPLFLIVFGLLIYQLNPLFKSYDFIFSLSLNALTQLISLAFLILLSSVLFVLFSSLCQDWKFTLPVGIVAALIPLVLTTQPLGIILAVGTFISILLSYLTLENKLNSYLTFEPNSLLGPGVKHLSGLLVIVISLTFFLSINKTIQQNGFQIPDSIIDTALKFTGPQQGGQEQQTQTIQSSLSQDQIDLLKKNPDLLKQAGLDPSILNNLNQSTSKSSKTSTQSAQNVLKQTVKDQLNNIIKPYLGIIPAVLAVLLFLTLQSLTSFLGLLIYPLLWITFYILEKSGFITFVVEQRPVKKMIV